MTFGDDIFYNRLKQEFYSENNMEVHTMLVDLIEHKVCQLFPAHQHLIADICQEAALRIMGKAMHDFLDNDVFAYAPGRVASRNKWFRNVVRNAGIDYLRAEFRNTRVIPPQGDPDNPDAPHYEYVRSLDVPVNSEDENSASLMSFLADRQDNDSLTILLNRERVHDAFLQLFSLSKTKPEKIIVCAFVVLGGHLGLSGGAKDLNSTIASMLEGMSYFDATDALERMLRLAQVSPSVLEPLRKRLNETTGSGDPLGKTVFDTDTRTITHQFSSTRKQLRDSVPDPDEDAPPKGKIIEFPSRGKDGKKK